MLQLLFEQEDSENKQHPLELIINNSGNVGIATTNPNNILQVGDGARLKISNGVSSFSLIGTKDVDDGTNTRIVISGNTRSGGAAGYIEYVATATGNHIFYTTDSTTERMRILSNGNVGIGTNNPRSLLNITGTNPILTIMGQGGAGATSQLNLSTYDHTTFLSPCSLIATDNGTFGSSFQIKQKTSGANANAQFTSLSIDASGTVNIVNTLQVAGNDINNFLFNNTGRNHSIYQDFNAIDKFGYTYMWAGTNGPGTAGSYYSWYIGLGNEYPFANSVNGYYGMQFAIGRSETYPKLSVRRKENNAWTGWEGLTAEKNKWGRY